jgi:hypothetical protein
MHLDQEAASPKDAETTHQLGTIVGLVGAFSGITAVIAVYGSWAFARGLMTTLGFSAAEIGLKESLDLLPSIAFEYTIAFMVALAGGFYLGRPMQNGSVFAHARRFLPVCLLLIVGLMFTFEIESPILRSILLFAALLGPLCVGYTVRIVPKSLKLISGLLVGVLSVSVWGEHLYVFGKETAHEIAKEPSENWTEGGMAATKLTDYPTVHLFSKDKLLLQSTPTLIDNGYLYAAKAPDFIRLVFADADKYYIVESKSGKPLSIAISKTMISQIQFKGPN